MKKIQFLVILLLVAVLTATPVLAADILQNLGEVNELPVGDTILSNLGTVQSNLGTVSVNNGTVITNTGTVSANNKVINRNLGTITSSIGTVTINDGTVTTNQNNAIILQNNGTVDTNNGIVYNYDGGTVTTNGGIVYNYGGTVTTNKGIVYNCGGTVNGGTGTIFTYHKLNLTVKNVAGSPVTNYTLQGGTWMDYLSSGNEIWVKEGGTLQLTPADGYLCSNLDTESYGEYCNLDLWNYAPGVKISDVTVDKETANSATATVLILKKTTVAPTAVTYDRYAPAAVTLTKQDGDMTFRQITLSFPFADGSSSHYLEAGTEYTVSGDVITLTPAYLSSLPVGTGTLSIGALGDYQATLVGTPVALTVTDSTPDRTVSLTQAEGGTISADQTTAKVGDTVTVTATPKAGYRLQAIFVDGVKIAGTTFRMKDADAVVTAQFEAVPQETTAAATTPAETTTPAATTATTTGETTKGVATGDSQNLLLYAGVAAAAVLVFVGVLFATKKKKQ